MRGVNVVEIDLVNGGMGDSPYREWPDRSEIERQIEELRDLIDEQNRRNALPPHA